MVYATRISDLEIGLSTLSLSCQIFEVSFSSTVLLITLYNTKKKYGVLITDSGRGAKKKIHVYRHFESLHLKLFLRGFKVFRFLHILISNPYMKTFYTYILGLGCVQKSYIEFYEEYFG